MSKKKEEKKNGSCSSFILAIMLVALATKIFSCGNAENDDEEYAEQTQEEVQEVELSNHDKFIQDATAIISQTDAENDLRLVEHADRLPASLTIAPRSLVTLHLTCSGPSH